MTDPITNNLSHNERLTEILAGYLESERSGQTLDRQRLLVKTTPTWPMISGRSSRTMIG